MIAGKVLITGGTGTLGKAILTLAEREKWPAEFTIFSRSELQQARMRVRFPHTRYIIGDVRDYERVESAVAGHDVVIHAAAMKRIPECEAAPIECWHTNVIGSANVARACNLMRVPRCIGISTDKACKATTMYGASKLALENIFRHEHRADSRGATVYTLVRYGNVVASRGSVIEKWREQYAAGLPVTITDGDMTRFWMSPFDAVRLVEEASDAKHGQIIVGRCRAMSIMELKNAVVGRGATFHYSGLRSVEKQHEDLVHEGEGAFTLPDVYILDASGQLGISFSSDKAERLTADALHLMLADAESLE